MKSLQNISNKVKSYFNNATWDDEIKQKLGQFASNPKINNLANNFNTQVNQARAYQQQNPTSRVLKDYVNNTYVAAARDIPHAISGIVGTRPQPLNIGGFQFGSKTSRVLNVGSLGLDVVGAVPDPTDIVFASANYLKGYKQARNQGGNFVQSLQSGEQTMAGNKYVGLGDSIGGLTDKQRTVGNLAELPLVLAAGFARNRSGAKQSIEQALKNEQAITELVGATKNWRVLPQDVQIGFIDNLRRVAEQVIPDVVNNKEFRKQTATDPETWIKTTSRFLEEALTAAKNPDKLSNFGFQAKPLRKLDDATPPKGVPQSPLYDTYGTVKEWGTRNQYVANNPYRKQLDQMKITKKFDMDVLNKAERWEMEQVLKDKPAFLSDNLSKEEITKFAKKNNLWFRTTPDKQSIVVAKDMDSLNRVLNSVGVQGKQRELGLALGYEDLQKNVTQGGLPSTPQIKPNQSPLYDTKDYIEVFHGGNKENLASIDKKFQVLSPEEMRKIPSSVAGDIYGLSTSTDKSIADYYASLQPTAKGATTKLYISKKAKFYQMPEGKEIDELSVDDLLKLKDRGYDAVKGNSEGEVRILRADKVLNKSQIEKMPQSTNAIIKNDQIAGSLKNQEKIAETVSQTSKRGDSRPLGQNLVQSKIKNVAQGGLSDVTQAGIKETGKIAGIKMSNQIPEPIETFRSTDVLSQGKQTTPAVLDKTATETQTQSLKQILQSKKTSSDDIISEGKKAIGSEIDSSKRSTRQVFDDLYTQWVDRYHPISRASKKAKIELRGKNAELRPEFDPDYLVRRLTGAGGVADNRFKTELNPILKQVEDSGIDKSDMDTYLAHNRMIGFDEAGREIYGVDPIKSRAVVQALEQKYPEISKLAQEFYSYEDKGFQELVEAGFINAKDAQGIRSANPNYAPLYRVRDELDDYLGLPTRKTMQGTSPIKGLKGSKRKILSPVESIIGDTFSQRAAIEKNRVATSIVDLNKVADMGFDKVSKSGSDTITVWRDGKKEFWRVGNDIADTAKGVNEEATNTVLKIIQAPAQLLRQGATGRNPEFMVPNIIRDQIDAGITSKYGYIPFIDFASGLKSMIRNEDVYQSWQKSGAKIDLGELSGRKSISKFVDEKNNKRNLFQWVGAGLDVLGKYSEQPTRVGLYKKAFNKTGNPLLAAMESRDATVDFARMGSKMKVANSIIPFLNVGVQGFDKLVRATKERPGRVLFNAGIYAAAPAVMTTLYNLLNFKEEYMEIPQYEKDSNFVLVIGRNADGTVDYRTFPKGNVVPFVANPVQSLMEHFAGADEQGFKAMALRTLSDGLPVLSGGGSLKEIGLKTIGSNLPQAVKPITESLINKSFYKYDERKGEAKDIVPFYMKDKPAYQQDYEFTPQMYKKIGAVVNVSPLQVKNLMEGYLAGYAKIPAQVIEAVYKSANGEPINPNDKTLIRRFAKQTYPTSKTKAVEEVPEVPNIFKRVFGDTKEAAAAEELPIIDNDFKVLYDDATKVVSGYADNSSKIRTGLKDNQTLEEAQTELVQAQNVLRKMEQEQPERVYKIGLDVYESDGGKTTEERADWAYEWLGKAKDEKQYEDWYQEMLDKKVLTKAVVEQLVELGLDVSKYVEGGKVKSLGGSGGKAKKLKLSGVNFDVPTTSVSLKSTPVPQAPKINLSVPKGSTRIAAAARPRSAVQTYKPQTFKNDLTKGIIRL